MKSHESDLLKLAVSIYIDAAAKCNALQPDDRDLVTLRHRVKHEGLSFLTITLPSLGKDFERCLADEAIGPGRFRSFGKRLKAPAFLQGFFNRVFDVSGTGRILNEPDLAAIEGIRQMAYSFKKLKVACTPERTELAYNTFTEGEHDFEKDLDPGDLDYFTEVRRAIWPLVLSDDCLSDPASFLPKHGPGATAERISGNRKYRFRNWYDRLEPYFPLMTTAYSSESAYRSAEFEALKIVSEEDELPVRVIAVPKTLKKPRIIAIEPVCMQYAQQAISQRLVQALSKSTLTGGHVNFTDQQTNRDLALKSSKDGSFATLDLSSASDRVPLSLAISMFESNPDLMGAILACRSRRAQVPNREVITLRKFASMGSALCFPIEAMYFYTICVAAILRKRNLPVTFKAIRTVAKEVYVYGDDIIVPTDCAYAVSDHLHKYYCKVNMSKSFWSGKFRESCGMDAYAGESVIPTYVHHLPPRNRQHVQAFLSLVETSNLFYERGYWSTASLLVHWCERVFGKLPVLGPDSPGVGLRSYQRYVSTGRWNHKLHRHEVKAWLAGPVYQNDRLEGYGALLKSLLGLERRSSNDVVLPGDSLEKTARYGAVTLKRRWTVAH